MFILYSWHKMMNVNLRLLLLFAIFRYDWAIGLKKIDCLKWDKWDLAKKNDTAPDHEVCDLSKRQTCIQFIILPTTNSSELRYYGCANLLDIKSVRDVFSIEHLYNNIDSGYWVPRTHILINNIEYVGQLLMCMTVNMCNENIVVNLEGIYESKLMNYDGNESVIQCVAITIILLLFAHPIYFVLFHVFTLRSRHVSEEREAGRRIEPLPCHDKSLYAQDNTDRIVEDGKIPTLKELQAIYGEMREKRSKHRLQPVPIDLHDLIEPISIHVSRKAYKASSDLIIRISRSVSTRFDNLLFAMLCFGPTTLRIKAHNMASLFADFYDILFYEPALVELPSAEEYLVISDLRGEYRDLHRWLRICGFPPTKKLIVLGGALSDENLFSLETFVFLATLKVSMPYDVYILRGAPESLNFEMGRMESRSISNAITTVVSNICERLPVAACIGSRIFCVHAGISPLIKSLKDINNIDRSRERLNPDKLLSHLIFSEPSHSVDNYEQMTNGRGLLFGVGAVKKFCENHTLSVIIRGHNPIPQGFFFGAEGRLLSLWSTPGYDGCDNSAVAMIHADSSIEIVQMSC